MDAIDAARFAELAESAMADIGKGKLPILCGGTYLWMRAVLHDSARPPADEAIRAPPRAAEREGRTALHAAPRRSTPDRRDAQSTTWCA